MTVRVLTFTISQPGSDRRGFALLAPAQRYCSILWQGADRIDRRFATPGDWRAIETALTVGLPSGPLPATHPVLNVLLPRESREAYAVQYVSDRTIDVEPLEAAQRLDAELRTLAA